ncbi:tRNA (cytosine(32)/uridine(32)-2'-O)-methyltransferase TrmJ [Motiliproteus sp. SC1-56]|uniref:tRNA (cytosine(32)/uridine(32)-2'-O)-methyltransferase TrmJ n=1 Tax=Motiliproteus sp. SC1-56 TaxID=2799565 RepID=UPI001A8E5E51|nr:tRNA (cytosine(32)/uridine(32)-2'-O)-methyltransferase TrmJ [Motiliproteus sp. SC1-56]
MFERVRIVLVNTSHPGNIGGVARAMKNMGFSRLVLVDPKAFPDEKATARASGATEILERAQVVPTLDEALEGCNYVVGASARGRHIPWPVLDPRELASEWLSGREQLEVALVFGREDRGLTNEELHRCHKHVHIPADPEFSSLNLAAAVQVLCYELRMAVLGQEKGAAPDNRWGTEWDIELASAEELQRLFEHLERTLVAIDFLDPDNPRQLMTRLRRLYLRSHPDRVETNILRGILSATEKLTQPQD